MNKEYVCSRCEREFVAPYHNLRKLCDVCGPLVVKERRDTMHKLERLDPRRRKRRLGQLKRYRLTAGGRATHSLSESKRRRHHTDIENYKRRVRELHEQHKPCVNGHAYVETHQVDHIVPLFKGGTDEDANLQEICRACHSLKTAIDLGKPINSNGQFARRISTEG